MSGHSYNDICPNCGNKAEVYTDCKPFSYSSYTCLHCGLMIFPMIDYMTLELLNEMREENKLEPLSELPENQKRWF